MKRIDKMKLPKGKLISNVEDYLEHTKMLLSLKDGYPCVSLLPDLFGQAATDIFVGCVKEWQEEHKK